MDKKIFDLTKSILWRQVAARLLILILGVIAIIIISLSLGSSIFDSTQYHTLSQLVGVVLILLTSILLYIWGGKKASSQNFTLSESAQCGAITGFFVGVIFGILSGLNLMSVVQVLLDIILGIIFTLLGAFIFKKIK